MTEQQRARGYPYADGPARASCGTPPWRSSASATGGSSGPIFIGDTSFVNDRIAELRDSRSRPTQAIATFEVGVVDQDERVVQRGRKSLLVSKVPLRAVETSKTRQASGEAKDGGSA